MPNKKKIGITGIAGVISTVIVILINVYGEQLTTGEWTKHFSTVNKETKATEEAQQTSEVSQGDFSQTQITEADAKKIILERVPGATELNLLMQIEYEGENITYEGTVIYGGMEYEYELDAKTGMFYSWDVEPIDD